MADLSSDIFVSAIIVTCNSENVIAACLKSLRGQATAAGGEIMIIDNNSRDATIRSAKAVDPSIKILQSKKNIGFAAAVNKAAESARGKYLLFLNPDVILDEAAVRIMLDAMAVQPSIGAAAARMRNPDGTFQPTCRNFPDISNMLFSRGSILSSIKKRGIDKYTLGDFTMITEVPAASATCLMIERTFFNSIGGFDIRFFLFMEDTDLCLRIRQAGKKIYMIPEAGGVHLWGGSSDISSLKRSWHHHQSVWRYFLKHYPNGFSVFLLPLLLALNFVARAAIEAIARRRKPKL